MKPPLPVWSIPFMLVIVGIVLFVGHLPPWLGLATIVETVAVCAYVIWRARQSDARRRGVANVLPLYPAHLLLLLAIARLPDSTWLGALWTILPVASLAYDAVAVLWSGRRRPRASILSGLYAIIWADIFYLWERVIALARGFSRTEEILVAAAFGVFGSVFLSLGIYRHWRAGKE